MMSFWLNSKDLAKINLKHCAVEEVLDFVLVAGIRSTDEGCGAGRGKHHNSCSTDSLLKGEVLKHHPVGQRQAQLSGSPFYGT